MINITAANLHRIVANARILQPMKGWGAEFSATDFSNELKVYSADSTTLISDKANTVKDGFIPTYAPRPFKLSPIQLSQLDMWLREVDDTEKVRIVPLDDQKTLHFSTNHEESDEYKGQFLLIEKVQEATESIDSFIQAFDAVSNAPRLDSQFAINPDRLRKLALIKPGDYPIAFKMAYNSKLDRNVLLFKAGPTVRGILDMLDLDVLRERENSKSYLW